MQCLLRKFTYSPYYTAAIALIAFFGWFFDLFAAGLAAYAVIFAAVLIFSKDTTPLIPPAVLCTFMISKQMAYYNFDTIIYILVPLIVISIVLFFILKRPKLRKGSFFWGYLLAAAAMVTGGIGFDYNISNVLSVAGLSFAVFFIYVLFYSTAGENLKRAALHSFTAAVIVILLQLVVFYIRAEDIYYIIENKVINVGWGISNNMAFVLSMFLPVTFYKVLNSRYYLAFLALAFIQYTGIVFTLSRGNILFGGMAFLFFIIFCAFKTKYKKNYIITALAITVLIFSALIISGCSTALLNRFIELNFDDTGRIKLLQEGLESLKLNPIFGIGFFYKHELIPHWFHNFPIQIIASMGIIGIICYGVYFYQRYSVLIRNFNLTNFFMISCIILSGLYALMECNFFFVYNMLFIMLLSIIIEREKDTYNLYKMLKTKFSKNNNKLKSA